MMRILKFPKQNPLDTEPFLSPSGKISKEGLQSSLRPLPELSGDSQRFRSYNSYLYHALAVTINLILAIILLWQIQSYSVGPGTSPMFLRGAIRYKQIKFTPAETSPLFGAPGPQTDAAWESLIDDASLRLSEAELSIFNSSSINLQDSRGKLVWLEVSHQIHCVDYIRKAINRNHYYLGLPESEWQKYIIPHLDHCLNDMLQNTMCRGDTTPKFFEWEKERVKPVITSNYHLARTCVDLEYLKESIAQRVVSHEEMRRLKNPLLYD